MAGPVTFQLVVAVFLAGFAVQLLFVGDSVAAAKRPKPGKRRGSLANASFSHYVLAINAPAGFCNTTDKCVRLVANFVANCCLLVLFLQVLFVAVEMFVVFATYC